jgi:Holliday junction resolvasome RuvABC endonuclease subunit
MTTNGETIKYRVTQLERCYEHIDTKLDRILENHIPHLQQEIESLKVRVNVTTVINVGAIIIGIIILKFFQ